MKARVRNGELIYCVTDKSGRWACDTVESYKEACMNELNDDTRIPEIDHEEHDRGERELNCHVVALLRMLGLEDGAGTEGERLRRVVQANGTGLAPFYGLRKDHKSVTDEMKGPRVRPLCGARECSTRRASYLLCQLLTPLIVQGGTQCRSEEDCIEKVKMVIDKLDVSIPDFAIDRAHRLGPFVEDGKSVNRPVIVRFVSWRARTAVYRKREKKGKVRLYIDLTKRRFLLKKSAEEKVKNNDKKLTLH